MPIYCEPKKGASPKLKMDIMAAWMDSEWIAHHPKHEWRILYADESTTNHKVLAKFARDMLLEESYLFVGSRRIDCPVLVRVDYYSYKGELADQTGAFIHTFVNTQGQPLEILLMSANYTDAADCVTLVCLPEGFFKVWVAYERECERLEYALEPGSDVIVIGGRTHSFEPAVAWEDVILPESLKADIFRDVNSFFARGAEVYKRLNLKPFRKLLLAGVPGTGKTMLCSALAKWALGQGFVAIYISSARKESSDEGNTSFNKVERALNVARNSQLPALIILEELDAYLNEREKPLILNVLDGSEAAINERGTLLIATTNYPEAIDERILKRPGRLDRIFIIPEAKTRQDAGALLRQYLAGMWQDEHEKLVRHLVGYPGAFIREVAVNALTQVAFDDLPGLPLELLMDSFHRLQDQIDARDDFLMQRREFGFERAATNGANGSHKDE
jgi:hypothetical protein